jgi:Kef-type K+ transport system membrane component KefB/mannitol/fructose-specific phosphotransferase system IIA component (Ntr-type)
MRKWLSVLVVLGVPLAVHASNGEAGTATTQRMMVLLVQLGILLFASQAGRLGFARLRLPGVLGELAAGVVVGPFLLGALSFPGFPGGLFPAVQGFPVSPEVYGLCSIAAVLLVFVMGLETDLRMFLRYSAAGTAVGIGGVLTSFVLGDLAAVLVGAGISGQPLGFMDVPCLLLGVVSTATSVSITARILAERQRLGTPEGITTLGGAAVGDVLGILALAAVLGVTSARAAGGGSGRTVGAMAAEVVGAWLLVTLVGMLIAQRVGELRKRPRGRTTIAILALGLALVLAGLFEKAGLALIVGAYVMGLTLSRTELAPIIREKLEPLYALLVPVFFAVTGMLVDVRSLGDPRVLGFGLLYTAVAVLAKVIGCGVPAVLFGFTLRGALRVGVGMVPRGEVALILAGVGMATGALSQEAFGVAVLMTALTAICAPPVLLALSRSNDSGVRRQDPRRSAEVIRFPFGNPRQAEWIFNGLQDTLSRDGFFVHVLEHEGGAVLALREGTSIAFRQEANDIVFTCEPSAGPVVRTAVLYVVRDLRVALEAMRRPLDVHHLLRSVPSGPAAAAEGHDVKPYLRPDLVKLRLRGTTGPELLGELVALVQAAGLVETADDVLTAVVARERSLSTGLERGIAVPHCRTDAVKRLTCAIGLKPEGVDFGAFDGQPSRVFVLTLSPLSDPAPHVQFMSQMVQVLTPSVCRRLLRAESTHEVIAILSARPDVEPTLAVAPPPRQPVPHALRADALTDAVVVPRLRATTKEDAIDELLSALAATHPIEDLPQVRRQLLQREQVMSTGLERGIAVPHCRTAAVSRVFCALGLKPEGLDFGSQDGAPAQIVVLILASTSMPTPYAQTLALLLHALNHSNRTELFACTDAAALHAMVLRAVEGLDESTG